MIAGLSRSNRPMARNGQGRRTIRAPAGTTLAPAYSFSSLAVADGWRSIGTNTILFRATSTDFFSISGTFGAVVAGATRGFCISSSSLFSPDVYLLRRGAGSLQLGTTVASPVAQTISVGDPVGTDIAGVDLTLVAGSGTGTGRPGSMALQTANALATGTTVGPLTNRQFMCGRYVNLTEATATTFVNVAVAAAEFISMQLSCTVFASNGTDHQVLYTDLTVTAVNKAGVLTVSAVTAVNSAACNSSGTLTPVTYTAVAGTNSIDIKVAATSSLTQTILRVYWIIGALNSNGTAVVTPI